MTQESQVWETVTVTLPNREGWDWGSNKYRDWALKNCSDEFSITRTSTENITARFKNPLDATNFLLRWAK